MTTPATWDDPVATWADPDYSWTGDYLGIEPPSELGRSVFCRVEPPAPFLRIEPPAPFLRP